MTKRLINAKELISIFKKAFASKPRSEWLQLFNDKDLVICAVNTQMDALNDPQMIENGYVVDFEHPDMGNIKIPGFPIHFSQAEVKNTLVAPKLGENTTEILHDMLSYPQEEIDKLRVRGVI
jgi:crotonobetainyl-CoA:carnitine CoA-transferase CaiB-like acyl-CoA transferase